MLSAGVASRRGEKNADPYEQKTAGEAVTIPTAPAATAPVVDMLAALQASVGRKKVRKAARATTTGPPRF